MISIIALLIAILLPSLASARFTARALQCGTQQQQIGRAMAAYSTDANDYMTPVVSELDNVAGQLSYDDQLAMGGYDGRSPEDFRRPTGFQAVGFDGAIKESPLWQCPLDTYERRSPSSGAIAQGVVYTPRTYSINRVNVVSSSGPLTDDSAVIQPTNATRGVSGNFRSLRYGDVTKSSNTIQLAENMDIDIATAGSVANNIVGSIVDSPITPSFHDPLVTSFVRVRISHHDPGSQGWSDAGGEFNPNYLFVDGHVKALSNVETVEDALSRAGFDFRNSMWDAFQ